MEKRDARRLGQEALQLLREQAIRLRSRDRKLTYEEIAEIVGVHKSTVCGWCKAYERGGEDAIQLAKRGRKAGTHRTLSAAQEKQLRRMIEDKTPDQIKMPFALWTRGAVRDLVRRLWEIEMPIRTVGEYLKRWGFTPQKPLRRAYEQNPALVRKWLNEDYPAIAAKAKKENAEIHWGGETGQPVAEDFEYASNTNTQWMNVDQLRTIVKNA